VRETAELKQRQATPDSPKALACIPSLQLSDIPTEASKIPTEVSTTAAGATLLTHDLFTNNVLYAEAALPLTRVPVRLLPLLPLFCRCALLQLCHAVPARLAVHAGDHTRCRRVRRARCDNHICKRCCRECMHACMHAMLRQGWLCTRQCNKGHACTLQR
jgi:Peptidase M16C associated